MSVIDDVRDTARAGAVTHAGRYLAVILLGGMALRLLLAAGLSGNDDMAVAYAAYRLLDEGWRIPQGHYEARFGLVFPLALLFRVFGVGIGPLLVMPMLASAAGIYLAWRIGERLFGQRAGLFAAASLALYPLDVEFSGVLFPDVIQGALLAGAFWFAIAGHAGRQDGVSALLAGLLWAWAYYVKVDSAVMGGVFAVAWLLGFIGFGRMVAIGVVALATVSLEMVYFFHTVRDPLVHLNLEIRAQNEVISDAMTYRTFLTYPKAMFVTVYQTGLQYYLLLGATILAVARRDRAAWLVLAWVFILHLWLAFGVDPFGDTFRLKPQLVRYLMMYAVPMAIMVGWFLAWCYERVSRPLTLIGCAGAAALALLCMVFNTMSYQAARASTVATEAAISQGWFPLYADVQSITIASFLLHGSPRAADLRAAQQHDFLAGKTSFPEITEPRAYLLINEEYARRLERRNLVTPIDPARFGMKVTPVLSVDRPLPAISYAAMRAMVAIANLLPIPALREKVNRTADELTAPGVARVYRLDR